jgi:hypothetical protein
VPADAYDNTSIGCPVCKNVSPLKYLRENGIPDEDYPGLLSYLHSLSPLATALSLLLLAVGTVFSLLAIYQTNKGLELNKIAIEEQKKQFKLQDYAFYVTRRTELIEILYGNKCKINDGSKNRVCGWALQEFIDLEWEAIVYRERTEKNNKNFPTKRCEKKVARSNQPSLYQAKIHGIDLDDRKVKFCNVNFRDATFNDVSLIDSRFDFATLDGATFDNPRLTRATFKMAELTTAKFMNVNTGFLLQEQLNQACFTGDWDKIEPPPGLFAPTTLCK